MANSVLELQKEVLSPNCDIVNVLRKAHLIAVKLKLSDFDQWIQYELNGYPNKESCPEYRKVRGTLKYLNQYYGWYPITIPNNEIEKIICERKISNAIYLDKNRNQKNLVIIEKMLEICNKFNF